MRIVVEVEPRSQPISGWFHLERHAPERFEGMLELMSLIDSAREDGDEAASRTNGDR